MSTNSSASSLVELASPDGFEATVDRLVDAIKSAGLLVIARIDHAGGARTAGLSLPPSLVLVYGHPLGGTPIMQAHPAAALDLPLRVLIRTADDGRTLVSFHPVADLLAPHGVPAEMAGRLEPAQALIRRALGQPG
jgi:uncharacterized protein (DUF302 family)